LFLHDDLLGSQPKHDDPTGLRTNEEADPASGAAGAGIFGSVIAVMIETFRQVQHLGWTGLHAKPTSLTFFGI
jgi:hypothetical protein